MTAAAANTGYAITYDAPTGNKNISLDATDATKIVLRKLANILLCFCTAYIIYRQHGDLLLLATPERHRRAKQYYDQLSAQ